MKLKYLFGALALSAILVGCSEENVAKDDINVQGQHDIVDSEPSVDDIPHVEFVADNNVIQTGDNTVADIKSFADASIYPENTLESGVSREIKHIENGNFAWRIINYADNHRRFITQDNHNEFNVKTKHGLLIYDNDATHPSLDKKWTNYYFKGIYFKGIYFNSETNQYELKFVVDSKTNNKIQSIAINSLKLNDVAVDNSHKHITYGEYQAVRPEDGQLFTIYVDKADEYPMEVSKLSFRLEIHHYNSDFAEGAELKDRYEEIFMELQR